VTRRKAAVVEKSEPLLRLLGAAPAVDARAGVVASERYALQPADLRRPAEAAAAAAAGGADPGLPTLLLLECVLVYMEEGCAEQLLRWAADAFPTSAVLVYDPTRPDDAFGRQMLLNLRARGAPFLGIAGGASPAAHAARLRAAGWRRAACADMERVQARLIDPGQLAAAERREPLDELEEWRLFQRHYVLALGVSDREGLLAGLRLPAAPGDSCGEDEGADVGAPPPQLPQERGDCRLREQAL